MWRRGCLGSELVSWGEQAKRVVLLTEIEGLRLGLGCQEPLFEQIFVCTVCECANGELSYVTLSFVKVQ